MIMDKFYYFFQDKEIVVSEQPINTVEFADYVLLTEQEISFYLEHPEASIYEVRQQMLYTDMLAGDGMKENIELIISDYSLYTSESVVSNYKVQNAITSLNLINSGLVEEAIYDLETSKNILLQYNSIGELCRTTFYQFKTELYQQDLTVGEMYDLEIRYRNIYDEIKNNNQINA